MTYATWSEMDRQHQDHLKLAVQVRVLGRNLALLEAILREQRCPNWGEKNEGVLGPCGNCAWCQAFLDD